ncbi:MAG: tRNA (adenosine(37)-N6)-dimethylallyltransferase MiaA [Flavisolibacter sp.]
MGIQLKGRTNTGYLLKKDSSKTIILIAGPTAVGKTSVAIEVARHFSTEIISADSRQCYKELNIGVARPSPEELQEVPHYFIASHSIHQKVNAVSFENYALEKASKILGSRQVAVMVGGTGLYIKAFLEGLDEIPEVPVAVHEQVILQYEQNGLTWLQEQLKVLDPEFYQAGEIQNPQRLMRALEVLRTTGKSIISFRRGEKAQRDFRVLKFALELPKENLHGNINHRVDAMMEQGLLEEVRSLIPYQGLNALQTVGYKELFEHFNGELTREEAVDRIKINTRQYAKRQMTWFKKDKDYSWMLPDASQIIERVISALK